MRRIIKPTRTPTGAFRIQFRSPLSPARPKNANVGRDETFARAVAAVLTTIVDAPVLCQALDAVPPLKLRELGRGPATKRALEIFYGQSPIIERMFGLTLTEGDLDTIAASVEETLRPVVKALQTPDAETLIPNVWQAELVARIAPHLTRVELEKYLPERVKEIRDYAGQLEQKLQAVAVDLQELADLRIENRELRRQLDKHVTATLGEAIALYLSESERKNSRVHYKQGKRNLESFRDSLPAKGDTPLRDVRRADVKAWVASFARADGKNGAPDPKTILKRRNFVTNFFRWCIDQYELFNPVEHLTPVDGSTDSKPIVAIDRLAHLQTLFATLASVPYWKALVMTATLAGPREGELFRLRIGDVNLESNLLRIWGQKTKRERSVPIEQTTLLPVLREHVARRNAEREDPAAPAAFKTDLLFPATVESGPMERKLTEAGTWSHSRTFLNAWARVRAVIAKTYGTDLSAPYFAYGPAEWRRTFATALGLTGHDATRIAHMMGNSDAVAYTHYVKSVPVENRWPFRWGAE